MTYTIADLARDCEVSEADAKAFVECLRVHTDKGWSIEAAIRRHISTVRRMAEKSAELAADKEFRTLVANMVHDAVREAG